MKTKIMYMELKTHEGGHDDRGEARIGRVTFSKSSKSLHYKRRKNRGQASKTNAEITDNRRSDVSRPCTYRCDPYCCFSGSCFSGFYSP